MADLLLDELPTVWEGRAIDPDFRHMLWLSNRIQRRVEESATWDFLREAFGRFYREPPDNISDLESAYQSLCRFYAGIPSELGTGSGDEDGSGDLTYDFHCDAPYIVAAFQQAYGIDLTTTKLHWWRFKALFAALPEDTRMFQIMSYRAVDLSRLEGAERERYARLKAFMPCPPGWKEGNASAVSKTTTRPSSTASGLGRITPAPLVRSPPRAAIRWPSGPRPRPTPGGCGSNARTPPVSGR